MAQSSKQQAEESVLDLKGKLRQLNKTLAGKGAVVAENAPLVATIKAVQDMTAGGASEVKIEIFKDSQLYQWQNEILPPMKLKDGINVSLMSTFAGMSSLIRLPNIEGLDRAVSIKSLCKECFALQFATLYDLPKCTDATSAFEGCNVAESVVVGNMPTCSNFYCFAFLSKKIKSITIGQAPLADNVSYLAYECQGLEEFTANFGENISNAQHMFYGCGKLRRINGVLNFSSVNILTNIFSSCSSLEEVRLKGLKTDVDLSACAKLSLESVKYLVDNLQQVSGKSITLASAWQTAHPTEARAYAQKATAKGFALTFR